MPAGAPVAFEPGKTPIQARSAVTVEAISEATIQVLLTHGAERLTTTRVPFSAKGRTRQRKKKNKSDITNRRRRDMPTDYSPFARLGKGKAAEFKKARF